MRYFVSFLSLIASLIIFTACGKTNRYVSNSLPGTWELYKESGFRLIPTYPPGNGNLLKLTTSGYEMFVNGSGSKTGSYELVQDFTAEKETCLIIAENHFQNRIVYDGDNSGRKLFLQVSRDTLTFLSGCFAVDAGVSRVYVRR